MKLHKFNKIIASLLISVFFCCSCTSYKAIKGDTNEFRISLKAGDKIRVTKSDGQVFVVRYIDVTDEILITKYRLSDKEIRIPLDQITKIEKKEFDGERTAVLIIGVVVGGFVISSIIPDPFEDWEFEGGDLGF